MSFQEISDLKGTWFHGSTGDCLMLLPRTEFSLYPAGTLLAKRTAPLCGELMGGGLVGNGVSYCCVSGTGPSCFERSVQYAFGHYPVDFQKHSLHLSDVIEKVQRLDSSRDLKTEMVSELAITILRVRQVSELQYQQESAEKIRSVAPFVSEFLEKKGEALERMHSLTDIKIPDATDRSLVQIMQQTFSADVLDSAGWSEAGAKKTFQNFLLYPKKFTTAVRQDILISCCCDRISFISSKIFWLVLLEKRFDSEFFESEIRPRLDYSVRVLVLLRSIFHGAVSADPVPVRLSQEEISQIEPFNQIPLIFASTLDLQAQVDQSLFPGGQFKLMEHEEIPLTGPLKLGRELDIVMTDPAHVPDLRAFLLRHRIQGVALVSFRAIGQNPLQLPMQYRKESLEDPMPQRPLALAPVASPADEAEGASSPPAADEPVPSKDRQVRGQKRQAQPVLEESANKRLRLVSEKEENLSSLRVIREMFLQEGQAEEAKKISEQIKILEDSFGADESAGPASRQPQPVPKREENLLSLYFIHEMLLQDGQVAEAQKIAEQIAALL